MDAGLLRAYCRTTYFIESAEGRHSLRIGMQNEDFDRWCEAQQIASWAFMTAANPWSEARPPDENVARMTDFEALLRNEGHRFWSGAGVPEDDGWEAEPSFLVANLTRAEARAYGERFGQNAVVYGERGTLSELMLLVQVDAAVLDEAERDGDPVVRWAAAQIRTAWDER